MKIKRRFVSFATQTLNPQRWLAAAKRKAVRIEVVAIGLLLLPVILVMADHLPFIDVSNDTFYHDGVSAIFGARITTGTTPTTFSPEDFVTRGQMAVFLHRGLGRVAYNQSTIVQPLISPIGGIIPAVEVARVTITPGGASAGTGFLKVDATLNAQNGNVAGNCPCQILFWLSADTNPSPPSSLTHYFTIYDREDGVDGSGTGTVTAVFPKPTANPQTVTLWAKLGDFAGPPTASTINVFGSITAHWVPFGATGGNTLNAASASLDEAPQGTEPDAKPDAERHPVQ